jgi:hypothetical protein
MSVYYLKPVVWNTNNYQRPSGVTFTSGYPMEHGFGHEEWNNSPAYTFAENGEHFRVFYTEEGFGNQPLDDFAGDIFVFMIASHDRGQYLVGVAGASTSLYSDRHQDERNRLVENLELDERWKDAWAIQNVKNCFDNNQRDFLTHWENTSYCLPNWKCPAHLFLWLQNPLRLDPERITGRARLVTMYGSYQEITRGSALDILTSINQLNNADILENLIARCSTDELDIITDITQIDKNDELDVTTKKSLIQARVGQGRFRQNLMNIWNSCAVTGCTIRELLRASHIKPWRNSTNRQRLDPNNGLLLEANLDALFDSGLISFADNGDMLVSARLIQAELQRLGIPLRLRIEPNEIQQRYLAYHRNEVFKNL